MTEFLIFIKVLLTSADALKEGGQGADFSHAGKLCTST